MGTQLWVFALTECLVHNASALVKYRHLHSEHYKQNVRFVCSTRRLKSDWNSILSSSFCSFRWESATVEPSDLHPIWVIFDGLHTWTPTRGIENVTVNFSLFRIHVLMNLANNRHKYTKGWEWEECVEYSQPFETSVKLYVCPSYPKSALEILRIRC